MDLVTKYINEGRQKWVVEIKGITHDWLVDSEYANKEMAYKVMQKAIKAGRKESHIRIAPKK